LKKNIKVSPEQSAIYARDYIPFFKLEKNINATNLIAFDCKGVINKYGSAEDILWEFFTYRMDFYKKRYDFLIKNLKDEIFLVSERLRFVILVVEDKLKVILLQSNIYDAYLTELDKTTLYGKSKTEILILAQEGQEHIARLIVEYFYNYLKGISPNVKIIFYMNMIRDYYDLRRKGNINQINHMYQSLINRGNEISSDINNYVCIYTHIYVMAKSLSLKNNVSKKIFYISNTSLVKYHDFFIKTFGVNDTLAYIAEKQNPLSRCLDIDSDMLINDN